MSLDKQFDFLKYEKSIYSNWEKSNCFKPIKNSESYCIMMPPPNVTGSLHMGHALTFTIQDILIRFNRMKGKEVLWQAGTDHAGIATQMVVERQLNKENISRNALGREKFIEKVWNWKVESGNKISNQLKKIGASADWSRERFTMDEGLSKAVKKVFVDLYNEGLIYKDKRLVNWDPKLLTAISDLEVEQKEIDGILWHIKYEIDENNSIIIATTRPETMLGDTAVAVNPLDERYKKIIGKFCHLPLSNRKIPIIADDYADIEKGSGAVKITPAHDFNDFEVGIRNNLEFINIFDEHAKLNNNVPKKYQNLDRYKARELILDDLKKLNLLIKEENQKMFVPYGDRSGVIIEPWLTDQWFCDAKKLSNEPIKNVKNKKSIFVPIQWEKTFFNWMENIQPWCISRQLWWGHQIPAWYGPDKKCFVSENENDAIKLSEKHYGKKVKLIQDEDVLDTWFSSALWTFSTLDWPNDTYELKRFYPGNVLVTGFDIIFFWVARMMMMGSYFMKETPFKDIYIHPLIKDEHGQKMSKSKGNIIDPLDLINKYGADTLRFTLTALLNPGRDVKLSESRVKGYKSFTNKIWNAAKFLELNNCSFTTSIDFKKIKNPINKWIIYETSILSNIYEKNINKYLFHEVANNLYHFIWHTYCDWYIEFLKSLFNKDDDKKESQEVSGWVFGQLLKFIHPIMPFLSEKLWNDLFNSKKFLMLEKIESSLEVKEFKKSKLNIGILIEIISQIRNLRSQLNIPYKKDINLIINNKDNDIIDFIKFFEHILKRLLKVNKIYYEDNKKNNKNAYIILGNTTISIPLDGVIDTKIELKRLTEKRNKDLLKLKEIESKLKNDQFKSKAPKNVIDQFKIQLKEIESTIEKTDQIINTIS